MGYIYAGIWLAIGLVLMIFLGRQSKLYIFGGAIFLLMGIWWMLQTIFPLVEFFHGWMNWVIKGILALGVIGLCVIFFRERRRGQ